MREIKFRQFLQGTWHQWGLLNGIFISPAENISGGENAATTPHCQFIGLKDKNGKEIYEGDILARKGDRFYYSVNWGKTAFGITEHSDGKKNASNFRYHWDGNEVGEVIGNIYENPELLK